jgi:hypothetical protein
MLRFSCLPFDQLTPRELYAIMALRQEVFVVEQNCPYLDADGKDISAWHLMGFGSGNNLIAYTRLLPEGVSYEGYTSIGRVVSSPAVRGAGRRTRGDATEHRHVPAFVWAVAHQDRGANVFVAVLRKPRVSFHGRRVPGRRDTAHQNDLNSSVIILPLRRPPARMF